MTQTQSDAIETTHADDSIPDNISGLGGSGRRFYNIKEGKFICRGTDDVVIDETDQIIGRLERHGLEKGAYRTGRAFYQLEIDIKTKTGPVTLRLDLLNPDMEIKPSVAALNLARGLIAARFEPGALIALQSWKSDPPKDKPHRRPSNHISVYSVDAKGAATRITPPKDDDDWTDYEAALPLIPGFAPRPKRNFGPTHYQGLCEDLAGRGWPTPEDNPKGWLALLGGFGITVESVDHIQDDTWGEVRLELQNAPAGTACPPQIAAAAAPKASGLFGGAPAAVNPSATAYDPAADE